MFARLSVSIRTILLFVGLAACGGTGAYAQSATQAPNPAEAIKAGDLPEAARQARRLAETGDPQSQFMLSLFLWHGVATPQNFEDAMRWVTLAAVSGERKALNARNAMLKTIEPPVPQKSMEWVRARLSKQAEGGDNDALSRLAISFAPTFGFANPIEAYFWSNLAVSNGRVQARKQRDETMAQLKPADLLKTQERARVWQERWRPVASAEALPEPFTPQPDKLGSSLEPNSSGVQEQESETPLDAPKSQTDMKSPEGAAREQ